MMMRIRPVQNVGRLQKKSEPMTVPASSLVPRRDAAKTPAIVTIVSDPAAKYSRTVDVLDALAVARIDNVTFTVSEEE